MTESDATVEPKVATLADFEQALRTLYEVAGLKVLDFTINHEANVARLVLDLGGETKVINVPLPKELR
jgi:hypothetical protein